jgi:hypothetical protein
MVIPNSSGKFLSFFYPFLVMLICNRGQFFRFSIAKLSKMIFNVKLGTVALFFTEAGRLPLSLYEKYICNLVFFSQSRMSFSL